MPRLKSVRGSVVAAAGDRYGIDHGQIAVASVALAALRYAAPVYYRRGSANERAARHQARNQDTLETSMLRNLSAVIVTSLTVAVLAGCGGGGSDAALDLGVVIAGQPGATVYAGQPSNIILAPGQSIELDASEPVIWNFSVNGSPLFDSGTTVAVQGLEITQSDLSASRVVLDTFLSGPTQLPVFVTLTATSTIDAALVATVTLQIQ